MKDNEYYKPTDEKKSVSDEKLTLEDQVTTILKKKFDFRLKNKNKKKKNTLNQSAALVMSSVAVVMVTTAAFPTASPSASNFTHGYFLQGEWESDNGIYMDINDGPITVTFSSDSISHNFSITDLEGEPSGSILSGSASFNSEYGELMASYSSEYNDGALDFNDEHIPINIEKVEEGILVDFKVFSDEPILFTPRVYNYGGFVPKFYGELWLSESSDKQILTNFTFSKILYFDGVDFGEELIHNIMFEEDGITAHSEAYETNSTDGNIYREPSLDHYFTGEYLGSNNSEMRVDITIRGELVVDNEVFYKAEILYDDYYWYEIYYTIWPNDITEPTPQPVESYPLIGSWESETGIYLEFNKDNSLEFSSDFIADSFTIYDNGNVSMRSVPNTAETYTNFNEEYGEIMKIYASEFGDSQIISSSEDIPIIITGVEEGIIVDFKVISPEPLLFTHIVYDNIDTQTNEVTIKSFVWYSDESEFNNMFANVTYREDHNQIMLHSESGVWRNGYIFTDPGSSIGGANEIIFIDPSEGQSADTTPIFITETDFGFVLQTIGDDGEVLGSFDYILVE